MRITVIGCGYVGLVAAACFAELGHHVTCVDNNPDKIDALNAGKTLIHEDYLPELLRRHRGASLFFSKSLSEAVCESLVIVIAVGTPTAPDGNADLSHVESVIHDIASSINGYKLIVEKSTVPVYTNARIRDALVQYRIQRDDFDVASNPEFLREGTAVTDFLYPDRIIVGVNAHRAAGILKDIYDPLVDGSYSRSSGAIPKPDCAAPCPLYIETSPQSAELIKHAPNAFLAMKISFINAVAEIAEAVGADIEEVRRGIGSDHRIGS